MEGESVPVTEVSDPVFGEETVGRGVAIRPAKGRVVAPADGEVSMMFRTGHAVAMTLSGGVEVLIHVGLDTVNLGGSYFTPRAQNGEKVKKGDLLIEFDMESIAGEGYDLISPVIVTNHDDYKGMDAVAGKHVAEGDVLIKVNI
jgi:PTS system beta-glucosides-specific IIC component